MKTNKQKSNWILDAVLFTGFLVSFALDLTGLPLHQWIGVFGGLLAVYHLALHWDWVTVVSTRFFKKTSKQARTYYLLDILLLAGFYLIVVTGLAMSTWLNLSLTNYPAWVDFHVTTSIVTLVLLVLKIGLHGRWIVRTARQSIFHAAMPAAPEIKMLPVTRLAPAPASAVTRRDFLKMMGIVSAASLAAFAFTLNNNQSAEASAAAVDTTATTATTSKDTAAAQSMAESATAVSTETTESVAVAEATPTATTETVTVAQSYTAPTATTTTTTVTSCVVRCDRHCSFPGSCRRYQDTNGNNLCDLGECM